jgi:type I restriction enzyme, R subunit
MKQAIQEGFILDVLKHYTPVESYYKLVKKVEGDPEFDTKRAKKKLRRYVESHDHAIRLKAEIMVDHFHEQVLALNKIGGQARAMVVTSGIERAIQYYHAIRDYLRAQEPVPGHRRLLRRARVRRRQKVTEASLNGFPSNKIADDPGGPVPLPDLRRQVPDRLRRAAAAHHVRGQGALGHQGGADALAPQPGAPEEARRVRARLHERRDTIEAAFSDYYRTTILARRPTPTSCTT